ncbi:hypothetical protein BSKO_11758 [Bryopsis sp. KO-2023]|nr:hypothetical protein BSKO_11758 [Bryopsis sp. KO-2023]
MLLNFANEFVELLRQCWVDFALWVAGTCQHVVRWRAIRFAQKVRLDVNLGSLSRENPGLSASSLSFYDDFHVISGIPAFFLDPDRGKPIEEQLSPQESLENRPTLQKITFYENKNAITCCNFSVDGSRMASGHDNGTAMMWSTEHGALLCEKQLHELSPVADIRFLQDKLTTVLSCDFYGDCVVWETSGPSKAMVLINCTAHWQSHLNLAPEVRWPFFSSDATKLVYPVTSFHDLSDHYAPRDTTSDPELSRRKLMFVQKCSLYFFDISIATSTKRRQHQKPLSVLSVAAGEFQTDFQFTGGWFSNSHKSIVAGFSASPYGFLVFWPDIYDPSGLEYELQGTAACWSPKDDCIATWYVGAGSSTRASNCYLWWIGALADPMNCGFGETGSRRRTALNPMVLRDHDGGSIVWAKFIPNVHGELGIVTCIIGRELEVILWDIQLKVALYKLSTGISWDETRINDRQAWDSHWVHVKRAYGLQPLDASADGKWLGLFSADTNKGFIWDATSGLQVLQFSAPEERLKNPEGVPLQMDFHFSPSGSHFALCNEENGIVWLPQNLAQSREKHGVNILASHSTDEFIAWGHVACKFSLDGETVAMCRSYSLELDIWALKTGLRCTLSRSVQSFEEGDASIRVTKESRRHIRSLHHLMRVSMASSLPDGNASSSGSRFCTFGLSPDGRQIVTCMADLSVLVWTLSRDEACLAKFKQVGVLNSKYHPAWAVCFSKDRSGDDTVVVCEDTGALVWIHINTGVKVGRRHGGGLKRCQFSADGARGALMDSEHRVNIWDLVARSKIQTIDWHLWLGPSGRIPFPHNVSMGGDFAFVGIKKGVHLNSTEGFVVCNPDTTEEDLADLEMVPQNIHMAENSRFVVVDKFVDIQRKGVNSGKVHLPTHGLQVDDGRAMGFSLEPGSIMDDLTMGASEIRDENRQGMEATSTSVASDRHTHREFVTAQERAEAIGESAAEVRYPDFDMCADEAWEYLLETGSSQTTDSLMVLDVTGRAAPKILKGKNLMPHRFISISPDGRRVACLSEDGRLFVWNAFATDGCLPDWHHLELGQSSSEKEMIELLERHGPGILNYPDNGHITIPMHAIYKRRHLMLECMVNWAVRNRVAMSLVCASGGDREGLITALDVAVARRSPECAEILLEHLPRGLTTNLGTTIVYKKSLLFLFKTYPSAFLRVMASDKLFMDLPHIMVPESTFREWAFKVTTFDTLMPTQKALQDMWLKTLMKSRKIDFSGQADGAKMIVAVPRVIPYPDIAQTGMKGFLKPLMKRGVSNEVFSSFAIRAIIHCQWKSFGRRLLMEELWHFATLWVLFTSYAIVLGNLWSLMSLSNPSLFSAADLSTRHQNQAAATLLTLAWILGLLGLVKELARIVSMWREDGFWGLLRWLKSTWRWVDVGAYALLVILIGPMHFNIVTGNQETIDGRAQSSTSQNRLTVVVCTESILLSWKMLRYAQGFASTAPMVIMIREIVKEILTFLMLAFGLMFGFAIAFFVLFRVTIHKPCTDPEIENELSAGDRPESEKLDLSSGVLECIEDKEESIQLFGNVWLSMLSSFGMMLGETKLDALSALDGSLRFIGTIMFVTYLLAIMVILLNLLIAVMGDSFEKVKATQDIQIQKGRAEVMQDTEDMMSRRKQKLCSKQIGQYLHVIVPLHTKAQNRSREWKGRLVEQKLFFQKELANLRRDIKSDMDERYTQMMNSFKMNGMQVAQGSTSSTEVAVPDIGSYHEVVERILGDDETVTSHPSSIA